MYLEPQTPLSSQELAQLRAELQPLGLLQDVLRWAFAQTPPQDVRRVIVQDEYSHDVIIPWRAPLFLVFDTT